MFYTPELDAAIRDLRVVERLTIPEVARRLGLTERQIEGRARRRKLWTNMPLPVHPRRGNVPSLVSRTSRPYTAEEDDAIRVGKSRGLKAEEIGDRIRRTKNSVIGRAHREGLWTIKPHGEAPPPRVSETVAALPPMGAGCAFPMWDHKERPQIVPGMYCGAARHVIGYGKDSKGKPIPIYAVYCSEHMARTTLPHKSRTEQPEAAD